MRRLIAGAAARDRVAKPLPPSNRGQGRVRSVAWCEGVSRAEPTPEDLDALAALSEPWRVREESDPARNQADAREEIEALARSAMLSPSEADAVALVARGVTVTGIAAAKGVSRQAVYLAIGSAIRKMAEPMPRPTPAAQVTLLTMAKKKSRCRAA